MGTPNRNPTGYYGPSTGQGVGPMPPSGNPDPYQQLSATPEDPLKVESEEAATNQSLFASNVALTYRAGEDAQKFEGVSNISRPPRVICPSRHCSSAPGKALRLRRRRY